MPELVGGAIMLAIIAFYVGMLVGWRAPKPRYLQPTAHSRAEIRTQALREAAGVARYLSSETSGPLGYLGRTAGELIARGILSIDECDNKTTSPPN